MRKYILVFAAFLQATAPVLACPIAIHRQAAQAGKVVVEREVVHDDFVFAAVFTPVAVVKVSQFAVGYAPGAVAPVPGTVPGSSNALGQGQTAPGVSTEVQQLKQEIEELKKALAAKGSVQTAPDSHPLTPSLSNDVFKTKCLACHGTSAAEDGGGFSLIDPNKLTGAQVAKAIAFAYQGKMPPKNNSKGIAPLTDDEVSQLVNFFNGGTK